MPQYKEINDELKSILHLLCLEKQVPKAEKYTQRLGVEFNLMHDKAVSVIHIEPVLPRTT